MCSPFIHMSKAISRFRLYPLDTMRNSAGVAGTLRAPSITGTMQLTGGDVQDFAQGVHLADMRATIAGAENTLRVTRFTAKAGKGTVTGSGTVGVLAAGIPLASGEKVMGTESLSLPGSCARRPNSTRVRLDGLAPTPLQPEDPSAGLCPEGPGG